MRTRTEGMSYNKTRQGRVVAKSGEMTRARKGNRRGWTDDTIMDGQKGGGEGSPCDPHTGLGL